MVGSPFLFVCIVRCVYAVLPLFTNSCITSRDVYLGRSRTSASVEKIARISKRNQGPVIGGIWVAHVTVKLVR